MPSLHLDPDRLFPTDASTRAIARELYALVAELPILSPHGHVDPRLLVEDAEFADPASLLIRNDHYVTRLLHAAGIGLERLGLPERCTPSTVAPRESWRLFCSHWHLFAGTASGFWLTSELVELFGVDEQPSAESSDRIFDRIEARLRELRLPSAGAI